MYTNIKSRVRPAWGIPAFFIMSLLALPFFGPAHADTTPELNLSIEYVDGDEGNSGVTRYKVTVTANVAPGLTDTGRTRIFRFNYTLGGTAVDDEDYAFGGLAYNNIEHPAKTHTSTLTIKGDTEQEDNETVIIKISRNDVHKFGLDRYPRNLKIGDNDTVTFTILDDD
ncbi:MAG: hypothetical protein OXI88_19045 [Gammaproteobacteria bacterium]|nr:hypothetical protein [Gammaproteobacteria bacterium]MDE0283273.1 hypothetical protein [Gammaproteobacteria bacterium]MDE0513865.1 hypothetical protein [Gammaproteobacteria bacterium]